MSESIDRSRRGFFTGSLLTREGKEKVKKQIHRLGLIPPGLQSIVSASHCQRCEAQCASACPENIIRLHGNEHELQGQPWLDFELGGCSYCGECNRACPNLKTPESPLPPLGKANIDENKCYTWSGIVCMSCVSVCPDSLFKFEYGKPSIALADCNGCGSCVKVCPASAISVIASQ